MYPAIGANVKLGKGALFLDMTDPDTGLPRGEEFLGNATGIGISPSVTKVKLLSSTEGSGGLVATDRTGIEFAVSATLMEFKMNNLALFLLGKVVDVAQAAATLVPASFESVKRGGYYPVGKRLISTVAGLNVAVPLIAGTDYQVNSEQGVIYILPNAPHVVDGDDLDFTYTTTVQVIQQINIGAASAQEGRLIYRADDANSRGVAAYDTIELWKVEVTPNGELGLITTDYAGFGLSMDVLSDAANHPGDEQYGRLTRRVRP